MHIKKPNVLQFHNAKWHIATPIQTYNPPAYVAGGCATHVKGMVQLGKSSQQMEVTVISELPGLQVLIWRQHRAANQAILSIPLKFIPTVRGQGPLLITFNPGPMQKTYRMNGGK